MEHLIRIFQKSIIKLLAIFESGLVTSRRNSVFKGYQQSFPDFIESAQASNRSEETCGTMHVDLEERAVDQLWDEVHGFMKAITDWMVTFLELFGLEEGNGLSPFTTEVNTPAELSDHLKAFLKKTKRYPRGRGSCNDDVDDANRESEISGMGSDDEMEASAVDTGMSPDVVLVHMQEKALKNVEAGTSGDMGDEYIADEEETSEAGRVESASSLKKEFLYDAGNRSWSYEQFRSLVSAR